MGKYGVPGYHCVLTRFVKTYAFTPRISNELFFRRCIMSIAVIVPVYNVERYLKECVDSIMSQTYGDFLLSLTDDGSSDGSAATCDNYAFQDERTLVIHQPNGGAAKARNTGLDLFYHCLSFEWLSFIDSDDAVSPLFLETLLSDADRVNQMISSCNFAQDIHQVMQDCEIPATTTCRSVSVDDYISFQGNIAPWCKLFRADLWSDVRFPDGKLYEDVWTVPKALCKSIDMCYNERNLYFYRENQSGLMHRRWSPQALDGMYGCKNALDTFYSANYPKSYRMFCQSYIKSVAYHLEQVKHSRQHKAIKKSLRFELRNAIKQYAGACNMNIRNADRIYSLAYPVLVPYHFMRKTVRKIKR